MNFIKNFFNKKITEEIIQEQLEIKKITKDNILEIRVFCIENGCKEEDMINNKFEENDFVFIYRSNVFYTKNLKGLYLLSRMKIPVYPYEYRLIFYNYDPIESFNFQKELIIFLSKNDDIDDIDYHCKFLIKSIENQ